MTGYLLSAVGVIFVSVIVSLLVPEGKLNKTIIFVMRMICIFVLIQPIIGVFKISSSDTLQNDFFDYEYVCEKYSEQQSVALNDLIFEKFGITAESAVEIEYENGKFKVNGVTVCLQQKNINYANDIYEYLEKAGYINISVYAADT